MDLDLNDPWLVAAWPGMGGIAQIAGTYLMHEIGAHLVGELPAEPYFDVRSVKVGEGLLRPPERPKSLLFAWKHPRGGRDLVIFVGEEQPAGKGFRLCHDLLDRTLELGVTRVVTFAAMATPIRPDAPPRVFAAATAAGALEEARRHDVEVLRDGEISGLNGVLLAAAAERGVDGICLLGEFPFFASTVANPRASAAILRTFGGLAGVDVDLSQLEAQAAEVERVLGEHLNRLERAAEVASRMAGESEESGFEPPAEETSLDPPARARIEELFREAAEDRSKALELKAELDRHGVFKDYEDRFLDLFKRAE